MRLSDKVAVITGAASGIGLATAHRFIADGAKVALVDIDADGLAAAARGLPSDQVFALAADVSVQADVDHAIAEAVARFGALDILINNAGIGVFGSVLDVTPADWRRLFAVDVDSVYFACRAALPHLTASRGCIVNTASIAGVLGDYGFAAYNAAKAAVINLTRALALDHAAAGVRVNAVSPGLITPDASALPAHVEAAFRNVLPMGRAGRPDEVAAAIAYLASDDASYVTGVNLVLDGGLTAATGQPNFTALGRR